MAAHVRIGDIDAVTRMARRALAREQWDISEISRRGRSQGRGRQRNSYVLFQPLTSENEPAAGHHANTTGQHVNGHAHRSGRDGKSVVDRKHGR